MKIFYFDTETTGLDPIKNDIVTLGGIIEIDGQISEEVYFEVQPGDYTTISKEALSVNKLTLEQLKTFMTPQEFHTKLVKLFSKYINKYNRSDKFICCGHNVNFDIRFLQELFKKCGDTYLGSWIDYHYIDTMALAQLLMYKGALSLPNCRLSTVAESLGIPVLNAHNALSDIQVTRSVFLTLIDKIDYKK